MNIQSSQQQFLDATTHDFESLIIALPVKPMREIYGNIFAVQPGLREGGHMVLTNTRLVYCPERNPGAWVWHFANLAGVSVSASLMKSVIMLSHDGVDHRWQTLKKGATEVMNAWTSWRQLGSSLYKYPEYKIKRPNDGKRVRCVKCKSPLPDEASSRDSVNCGACNSSYYVM